MKANVTPTSAGRCKVKLIPETEQKKEITDPDTLQFYYQRAITSKFGPKALLMSIDEMYPNTYFNLFAPNSKSKIMKKFRVWRQRISIRRVD